MSVSVTFIQSSCSKRFLCRAFTLLDRSKCFKQRLSFTCRCTLCFVSTLSFIEFSVWFLLLFSLPCFNGTTSSMLRYKRSVVTSENKSGSAGFTLLLQSVTCAYLSFLGRFACQVILNAHAMLAFDMSSTEVHITYCFWHHPICNSNYRLIFIII